jgi:hypothetical protein
MVIHSTDRMIPRIPASIRISPTVCRLNPRVVTCTANLRIAPSASKKIEVPRLIVTSVL